MSARPLPRTLPPGHTIAAVAVLLGLLLGGPARSAGPAPGKRHVLLLNSYDPTYQWTANIVRGARSVFDERLGGAVRAISEPTKGTRAAISSTTAS